MSVIGCSFNGSVVPLEVQILMYVTDNGPRGEIGNGSSLMARTEGMNRAGIIERP